MTNTTKNSYRCRRNHDEVTLIVLGGCPTPIGINCTSSSYKKDKGVGLFLILFTRWWLKKHHNTSSTTHNVSRQSAITSVENCVITLSSPSTMLPMNGCRTCVRSVDDRCEQYSAIALTAEIWTHGGCDGLMPATVACRNLQNITTLDCMWTIANFNNYIMIVMTLIESGRILLPGMCWKQMVRYK